MFPRTVFATLFLVAACSAPMKDPPLPPPWQPSVAYRTPATLKRGLLDRRGLIHAHSVHSHDACDGKPFTDAGTYDLDCNADFRRGVCQAGHDFVFLTDHPDSFTDVEFPDTLLYDAQAGDALVMRNGQSTASWMKCPDAGPALLMAGAESDSMMPVGLEGHVADRAAYSGDLPTHYDAVKAKGALALIAHPESMTVDALATLPIDGFEMYNLHANSLLNVGTLAELALQVDRKEFDGMPHPDLFLAAYVKFEDDRYLSTWGSVLARGVKRVTTLGTDCHRNTFPPLMQDGERVDSYRRMMLGFSNHVLVQARADGTWDDAELKAGLKAGRLYGAFEYLGYPVGFDAFATEDGVTREIGETVSLAKKPKLTVVMPSVQNLDPKAEAPVLRARWLKAKDGGWDVMAEGAGNVDFTPTEAGAYRAEIRMVAKHLIPFVGRRRDFLKAERPWVYANAIYVGP